MDWASLITEAIKAIFECIKERRSDEEIVEQLRAPRGRGELRMRRAVRRAAGLGGVRNRKAWRQQQATLMADARAEIAAASDDELLALIDEAKEDDDQ